MRLFFAVCLAVLVSESSSMAAERYLLPVSNFVYGSGGSEWVPELVAYSEAGATIDVWYECPIGCMPPFHVVARSTTRVPLTNASLGRVITVQENDAASTTSLALRVHNRSNRDSVGVWLPVVSERDFSTRPLQLLYGRPIGDRRFVVRIYSMAAVDVAEVELRVFKFGFVDAPDILAEELTLSLTRVDGRFPQYEPLYASYAFEGSAPSILGAVGFRVEVVSSTPGVALWSFMTETNKAHETVAILPGRNP